MVLCTPEWGSTGEDAYWRRSLDCITVGRTELPNGPTYVPEDCEETMPAPECSSLLSIVDGSPYPIPVCDLDREVLKELFATNCGFTLLDAKKRSKYPSVTTTSAKGYEHQDTPALTLPLVDASDHLSGIASSIPRVNPMVLTLKQSAFLAQLLMEEINLQPHRDGSHDHAVVLMRASDSPTGNVSGAKPSPNNMPVSEHNVPSLQQVMLAKAQGP